MAYFLFIGVFVWLCLSTQGGAESFMLTSNIRTAFAGFLEVRDDEVEQKYTQRERERERVRINMHK